MRQVSYPPLVSGGSDDKKLRLLVQKLVLLTDEVHNGNGAAAPGHVYHPFSCLPGDCSKHGEHLSCKAHFGSNQKRKENCKVLTLSFNQPIHGYLTQGKGWGLKMTVSIPLDSPVGSVT